ncbi:MAG: hypothetical protein ABH803_01900 [Candidatus Micrarchaeota archaeon]
MLTRRLCKWFERIFGAEYENRGKRSIEEVIARAEKKGFLRILVVYETHGNPESLNFLQEKWLEPVIFLKNVRFHDSAKRVKGNPELIAVDVAGKKFVELFNCVFEENYCKAFFSKEKIWFEQDGEVVGPELVLK